MTDISGWLAEARPLRATPLLWVPFAVVLAALFLFDLGVFQRAPRAKTTKGALIWSFVWLLLAAVFGLGIFATRGAKSGVEFFTGYVVEQALSVDNLFVILMVFAQFRIPRASQGRVLVWGILGAVILRGAMVFGGASLVHRFHVVTYAFGAILIYGAVKLLRELRAAGDGAAPGESSESGPASHETRIARWISRFVPVASELHGGRFTVVLAGVRHVTPLFLAMVTIELADAVFALDSIPAVFGVTSDPFIVLTSNLFALMGLRSMFFALSGLLEKLRYLKHGIALVLVVIGSKMMLGWAFALPAWVTLVIVIGIVGTAVLASVVRKEGKSEHAVRS